MRRIVLVLVGLFALGGCQNLSTDLGNPDPDFVGTYALRTIAGFPLPYSILSRQGFNLEVTADTVTLGADGVYVSRTHYRRTDGGAVDYPADTTRGTWRAVGRSITVETKGTSFSAEVTSIDLLIDPRGIPFSYRKQ